MLERPFCLLCFCEVKLTPDKLPLCGNCFGQVNEMPPAMRMDTLLKVHRNIESMRTRRTLEGLLDQIRALADDSRKGLGTWGSN